MVGVPCLTNRSTRPELGEFGARVANLIEARMFDGLYITLNSDDPVYFGGYRYRIRWRS